MIPAEKALNFSGRLLMLGFGAVGQGVLPLLLRHIDFPPGRLSILSADSDGKAIAVEHGIVFHVEPMTRGNYRTLLAQRLGAGDFLLNLSVGVSSAALIAWCRDHGVLYLDTALETWADDDVAPQLPSAQRTTYARREEALALSRPDAPTALITHGANPGLVSHLVKEALLKLADDTGLDLARPESRADWASLACRLGVRCIHIAEHDTQQADPRKAVGEFVNTWSVTGLIEEGLQPTELGWGSHEHRLPPDGHRQEEGSGAAIWLDRPGMATRVRTWTPLGGPLQAFLITHAEAVTLADYLTLPGNTRGTPVYRPTVHYAYHPCDDTVLSVDELAGRSWQTPTRTRVFKDEIVSGHDELGVLLMGHARGAYWYGSRLDIAEARRLAPHNNATSLQVAAAVLAGVVWVMNNPARGVVEPEALDHRQAMALMRPYLGEVLGVYSDWTPLRDRTAPFTTTLDRDDPWQFANFRID